MVSPAHFTLLINDEWLKALTDPACRALLGKSLSGGDTSGCDPAAASAVLAISLMAKRNHDSSRQHLLGKQSSAEGDRIHLSFHAYFGGKIFSFCMSK